MTHKHHRSIQCLLLLAVMLLFIWTAGETSKAAIRLTGKSDIPTIEQISNPKPAAGDIILPMPSGLHMTLRPVCVPAKGYLDDVQQPFGVSVQASEDTNVIEAWAERRYTASINASFEMGDMPQSWGSSALQWLKADPSSAAAAHNGLHAFLYFIGKYEVTRGQWRCIMDTGTFSIQPGDDKPVSNISWFDAIEFTRRYSEWLMQHHPEYLPYFQQEQRSSYVRLPTEVEWEYAARGGHRVTPVERERTRLHPVPDGADMGDYIIAASYDSTIAAMAAIGTRKANPLELYDIIGNCAEMVQTPFQLVSAGHLMGNQGGFVIKGGSWRSHTEDTLHPGRRIEASYYVEGQAQRRDDLGFRISLGSILTPKDKLTILQKEWETRRTPQAAQATPKQDVRIMIREVVREVESPALKQRLVEAEEVAARYHEQVNLNEERMLHEMLLGAAFSLETIANYASRCYQLIMSSNAYEALSEEEKMQKDIQQKILMRERKIEGFIRGIQSALFYYKNMSRQSVRMDKVMLSQQIEIIKLHFSHDDGFSKNMNKRLGVLSKHLLYNEQDLLNRDDRDIIKDILPDWLIKRIMPYWKL